jgi:hypothetical protein
MYGIAIWKGGCHGYKRLGDIILEKAFFLLAVDFGASFYSLAKLLEK